MKIPKIKSKYKKHMDHGHLWLHVVYWVHGIWEHPSVLVFTLYGGICGLTLAHHYLLEDEHSTTAE